MQVLAIPGQLSSLDEVHQDIAESKQVVFAGLLVALVSVAG